MFSGGVHGKCPIHLAHRAHLCEWSDPFEVGLVLCQPRLGFRKAALCLDDGSFVRQGVHGIEQVTFFDSTALDKVHTRQYAFDSCSNRDVKCSARFTDQLGIDRLVTLDDLGNQDLRWRRNRGRRFAAP